MSDVDVDLDRLKVLMSQLRIVRREFDGAEGFAKRVAELVGHSGLAGVVDDFATQWSVRRGELLEELDYLAETSQAIHDTMIELDQDLSAVIASYRSGHAGDGGGGGGGGGR